jgi:predicted RNase H-like HicB family nuclease
MSNHAFVKCVPDGLWTFQDYQGGSLAEAETRLREALQIFIPTQARFEVE